MNHGALLPQNTYGAKSCGNKCSSHPYSPKLVDRRVQMVTQYGCTYEMREACVKT